MSAHVVPRAFESAINKLASHEVLASQELGAKFVHLDVTSPESIAKAAASLPALNILVNNAGVAVDAGMSVKDVTLEVLRKTFDTNYFGVIAVTQAMLPLLRKSQHRSSVNVSSGLGSIALFQNSEPGFSGVTPYAYNSSKTALNMFTVLLAKERGSRSKRRCSGRTGRRVRL